MAVEFIPAEKEVIRGMDIYINGKKVGEMKVYNDKPSYKYHALLIVEQNTFNTGLAQGFGETEYDAVVDAFSKSKKEATKFLDGLAQLEKSFFS